MVDLLLNIAGWWFEPFWKIWVNWDDEIPNIWENKIHGNQTTNQIGTSAKSCQASKKPSGSSSSRARTARARRAAMRPPSRGRLLGLEISSRGRFLSCQGNWQVAQRNWERYGDFLTSGYPQSSFISRWDFALKTIHFRDPSWLWKPPYYQWPLHRFLGATYHKIYVRAM